MGIDFVRRATDLKTAYERERGVTLPTGKLSRINGQALIPPPKGIPRTTWGDSILVFNHLKKIGEPTLGECLAATNDDAALCFQALNFVRTASFTRAKAEFDKENPYLRASGLAGSPGNVTAGASYTLSRLNQVYPFNEELWGYAMPYVIARSAAGVVPHWEDVAVESVHRAIATLPTSLKNAAEAAWEGAKLAGLGLNWTANLIKWGSIGGGLFLLYWYVLKPKALPPGGA